MIHYSHAVIVLAPFIHCFSLESHSYESVIFRKPRVNLSDQVVLAWVIHILAWHHSPSYTEGHDQAWFKENRGEEKYLDPLPLSRFVL